MAMRIFSIESGRDVHLGVAGDIQTLVSLLCLAALRGVGVSAHGQLGPFDKDGELDPGAFIQEIREASQFDVNLSLFPTCCCCEELILSTPQNSRTPFGDIIHHRSCSPYNVRRLPKPVTCYVCQKPINGMPQAYPTKDSEGNLRYLHTGCSLMDLPSP